MNCFTLHVIGNLAKNPEVNTKGGKQYTRFCLIGTDYAGKNEDGTAREVTTSIWMVAFGALGDVIARNTQKGDQLFVEAHIRSNNWMKDGEMQYDHSFIVDSFRFGAPGKAKRDQLTRAERSQHAAEQVAADQLSADHLNNDEPAMEHPTFMLNNRSLDASRAASA